MSATVQAGPPGPVDQLQPLSLQQITLTYLFAFDLGDFDEENIRNPNLLATLRESFDSVYVVASDEITSKRKARHLTDAYREEMYGPRFKDSAIQQRPSVIIQLPDLPIARIAHAPTTGAKPLCSDVVVLGIATINATAAATLCLWLEVAPQEIQTPAQLAALRNIAELRATVDWRLPGHGLALTGAYSLPQLAKWLIVALYNLVHKRPRLRSLHRAIANRDPVDRLHLDACALVGAQPTIDMYPIYHLSTREDSAALEHLASTNAALLRGLVTGDANWAKKTADLVRAFMEEHNCSTRSTIVWLTHPNGSLKLYASDLETTLVVSQLLIVFELELIWSLRFSLKKLISNLNTFSKVRPRRRIPLRSLTRLRDQEIRRLDDYYSLDLLQKDTTIARLLRFRRLFAAEDLLQIAERKFQTLNAYMVTEYQNATAQRQAILTVVFGVFGAGTLAFHFLREAISREVLDLTLGQHLELVAGAMLAVATILYLAFQRTRIQ